MRLLQLTSDNPKFNTINFEKGLNIVVGSQLTKEQKKSINGIGKSMSLSLIHYMFGSSFKSASEKKLERYLSTYGIFELTFLHNNKEYTIKKDFSKTEYYINEEPIPKTNYPKKLNEIFFGNDAIKPTFKQIFNCFARRYSSENGMIYYSNILTQQGRPLEDYSQQYANLSLLGIDMTLVKQSFDIKDKISKLKKAEKTVKDYEKALAKEKALSLEDEINILYVALTRAKNNMIIFKKIKSSVFDILNMKPTQIGTIIQSQNISKNYEKVEKVLYNAMNLGTQEKQISKEKEYEDDYLKAKYFGIATHYCLEMMNDFSLDDVDYSLNLAKTRYSNYLDVNDFIDIKNRILLLIYNEKFTSLVKNSEFITEQSLVYKEEIKIIDLLLFKDGNYYIIDYKTTKEKSAEHITQVAFYKKAIKDIFKTQNVFSYLIYLHPTEVFISEV